MKISELSSRSGVAVASIKFYLREGLLAPGAKTSETQSSYDDAHLARLRLIRAFLEVGGLSVASARAVLAAIDDDTMPFGVAVGIAASALPTSTAATPSNPADADGPTRGRRDIERLVSDRGWIVDSGNPGVALAARVIDDYAALGRDDLITTLGVYADAAELIARADLQTVVDASDREQRAETVVIGTVLGDGLLAGLRRMAHENVSRVLFPVPPEVAQQHGHGIAVALPAAPHPTPKES